MTSLVCPKCHAPHRTGFTRCHACDVELVDAALVTAAAAGAPRDALVGKKLVAAVTGPLQLCREIERALLEAGIACQVGAENEEGESLSAGTLKVSVLVAEDDLQRVSAVLGARFSDALAREGVGGMQTAPIDLAAETVTCPACGHVGPLVEGSCADCGLFLGAPA